MQNANEGVKPQPLGIYSWNIEFLPHGRLAGGESGSDLSCFKPEVCAVHGPLPVLSFSNCFDSSAYSSSLPPSQHSFILFLSLLNVAPAPSYHLRNDSIRRPVSPLRCIRRRRIDYQHTFISGRGQSTLNLPRGIYFTQ